MSDIQFTGKGTEEAQHEIHTFLCPLNPDADTIQRYYDTVAQFNRENPDARPTKACLLCLVFRDVGPVMVMQTARYFNSNAPEKVIVQCRADAAFYEQAGFTVLRSKIEANAHSIIGIPLTDTDAALQPDFYFEHHIKVMKPGVTVMTDAEIAELTSVSTEMSELLGIPVPLSYNVNHDQFPGDGAGNQRFLNVRFRGVGLDTVKANLAKIVAAINETSFKVVKSIDEYVWYDTRVSVDKGWIDF